MGRMFATFRDKYLGGFPDESVSMADWRKDGFDFDKFANWYFATILKFFGAVFGIIKRKIFPKGFMWKVDLLIYAKNFISSVLTFLSAKFVYDRYNEVFWVFLLYFIVMVDKTLGEVRKKVEDNQVEIVSISSKLSER